MKRLLLGFIVSMFLVNQAFAAFATVTATEYGYSITGGTDATTIVPDTWTASTAYVAGDIVIVSGIVYECIIAHTSTSFTTNLASGDWTVKDIVTLWVSGITQKANSSTDTSVIKSGRSSVSGPTNNAVTAFAILNTSSQGWGGDGLKLNNPNITLGNAADIINIYIRTKNFN